MARKGMKLVSGVYVPLKGKRHIYEDDLGDDFDYFEPRDINSAVEGLIKFHEDRIEERIEELGFLDWDEWNTFRFIKEIEGEYESIMAIKHWFEDVIS